MSLLPPKETLNLAEIAEQIETGPYYHVPDRRFCLAVESTAQSVVTGHGLNPVGMNLKSGIQTIQSDDATFGINIGLISALSDKSPEAEQVLSDFQNRSWICRYAAKQSIRRASIISPDILPDDEDIIAVADAIQTRYIEFGQPNRARVSVLGLARTLNVFNILKSQYS